MKKIAICGGIGSGKSAISQILRSFGAKVIVADEVNAQLLTLPSYVNEIKNNFPSVVHNNIINKKELADIIFNDENERQKLMAISHPLIFQKMLDDANGVDIAFFEIPLFTLCPIAFDKIWYVNAGFEDRVKRISMRDNVSEDRARQIISLQKDELSTLQIADVVFENNGSINALKLAVKDEYCSILN